MRTLPCFLALGFPAAVWSAPDGGLVVAGSAAISQNGTTTLVTQNSSRAIINWNNFSTSASETVRFAQPDASAIMLNRVTGTAPSSLLGTLQANGNVFLVNPAGIVFGAGAQVSVGGLVASTHAIADSDFMADRFAFEGTSGSSAAIVNDGTLTGADHGYIALLAPQVKNNGIISARLGTVLLAGSEAVTLNFSPDGILSYKFDRGAINALVENHQLINADGGQVFMTAIAANSLTQALVRQDGVIEARTLENHNGTIRLLGDMSSGVVEVAGTLDASGDSSLASSTGGAIETSAAHVQVSDATRVNTTGTGNGAAGTWLIDPNDYTIAASGGDMTPATLASNLALGNVTITSASGGTSGNGDIAVNSAVNWTSANSLTLNAIRNIGINAAITNTAGGSLLLRSDLNGTGTGTVSFGASGSVALSGGGRTDIYYNPASFAVPTSFAGQVTGTMTAWMLVNSITALQNISTNLAGSYALGTNIDASGTASWNSGAGFSPLTTFTGKLDGLGLAISGLTINRTSSNAVAMISTNQGTISNLTLSSASVAGGSITGILTGINKGTINNVNISGTLSGTNGNGGVAGDNQTGGVISNASASVALTASAYSNGVLVGTNEGTIRNATTSGTIAATLDTAGGIVGRNNMAGTIDGSSSSVSINSSSYNVGGAAGFNSGVITNTYATGSLNVNGSNTAGGLVGANSSTGSISDSYATGDVSGASNLGGLAGTNSGSITRSWSGSNVSGGSAGGFVGSNSGTISSSYATGTVNGGTSANIGGFASQNTGTLTADYSTGVVKGSFWLGGLVGTNSGTISQSFSNSNVIGTAGGNGGLAGVNASGAIINGSYSTGTVQGSATIGGLVGDNSGSISNSYATGAVQATSTSAGGLVGKNESSGTVSYSYASGTVSGSSNYGGVFGNNAGTATSAYWNSTTSGINAGTGTGSTAGITGLTAAQFTSAANFTGFDFSGYWRIYEDHTVPLLRSFLTAVTVTADALGKVYDGAGYTGALMNATYSLAGATTSGHLLGVSTAYNIGKNVGVYAADLYTDSQQGYDITVIGGTYTIAQLTLSLSGGNAASKTYDGNTTTSVTGALSGVLGGDTVSILNGQFADKNAGTGKAVTVMLTGTDAANYRLTQPGLVADITQALLNIGATAVNKVYDGSTTATVTYSDNRIAGDSLTIAGSATFASKNVGVGKAVSVSSIAISGADAGNYTWNTTAGSTATITQAPLTLTGGSAASKSYDGTTTTTVSGTLSGLVSGDAVSIASGQFSDKNAASGKTVSVILAGSDLANYSFTSPVLIADIYKAVLTIGATAANRVYDGTTGAATVFSDSRISGDNLSVTGSAAFTDKNAGTNKTVNITGINVTGTDAGNYTWSSAATATATILQAPLSLTGGSAGSKTYDGTAATNASGTLAGLIPGDAVTIAGGQFADKNAGTGKPVSILLTGSDLANYSFSQPVLIADIYKASLAIGVTASDKVDDGSANALVAFNDNRIAGDFLSISGLATFSDSHPGEGKTVGVSNIIVTGIDAGNYTWNTAASTHASIKAAATVPPAATGAGAGAATSLAATTSDVADKLATSINLETTTALGVPDSQGRQPVLKDRRIGTQLDSTSSNIICKAGEEGSSNILPQTSTSSLAICR